MIDIGISYVDCHIEVIFLFLTTSASSTYKNDRETEVLAAKTWKNYIFLLENSNLSKTWFNAQKRKKKNNETY